MREKERKRNRVKEREREKNRVKERERARERERERASFLLASPIVPNVVLDLMNDK
jgi:hypothetical protein